MLAYIAYTIYNVIVSKYLTNGGIDVYVPMSHDAEEVMAATLLHFTDEIHEYMCWGHNDKWSDREKMLFNRWSDEEERLFNEDHTTGVELFQAIIELENEELTAKYDACAMAEDEFSCKRAQYNFTKGIIAGLLYGDRILDFIKMQLAQHPDGESGANCAEETGQQ